MMRIVAVTLFTALFLLPGTFCRAEECLCAASFPDGAVLGSFSLPEDGSFSLSFIHSVSNTPVRDDYRFAEGKITQAREIFETHGAGLPSQVDEPNITSWRRVKDTFIVEMCRPIPKLVVHTDKRYKNRLHLKHQNINLNQWPDGAIELRGVPCHITK